MKIKTAVTVWGKWISPVFDSAQTILIAEIENRTIESKQLFAFEAEQPLTLAKLLKEQGVSVLICGAISEYPAKVLESDSLKLIPFISGNAETILKELAKGKSIVPLFLMPGCKIRDLMCQKSNKINGSLAKRRCRNR